MSFNHNLLITGGAGFIGGHLVRHLVCQYPDCLIENLDKLTYAGNLENLQDLENAPNYRFERGDIKDTRTIADLMEKYAVDRIIHLAAESHVDRSIHDPLAFVETNVLGTVTLLNAARIAWEGNYSGKRFYHISTDEVFGSLGPTGFFTEQSPYDPRSPYSASKASSDHFVRAYYHTYGLPIVISNCSNNYGPYQFPEKLIPLMIHNIRKMKPLPVYGDGQNTRDWLWVGDHVEAIDLILQEGQIGETYNIGGQNEWKNIDLVNHLCDIMDEFLGRPEGTSRQLITFVKDRAGHDKRYAIDASKLMHELGWSPKVKADEGLRRTAAWYLENEEWLKKVTSGTYLHYYEQQYVNR